jgi:molybdate/tungstate transport system substrate-binding protein
MQITEWSLEGDVFISADPKVNAVLSESKNGDRVKWYVTFAESPLVLGISPSRRFADEATGRDWNEVLTERPGNFRKKRTSPARQER